MITALCGGVGGSKLVSGLYAVLPADSLSVVVNTADDLEHWGLHISPDLDTVTYTLAGLAQQKLGWGIDGDTDHALQMLKRFGAPDWFHIGDQDLATDIYRTWRMRDGTRLTTITGHLAGALGVRALILPMTDGRVETLLRVDDQWLDFQEYFVHRRHAVSVTEICYRGIDQSPTSPEVMQAIGDAETIIIVNSNPVLSIQPILGVPRIRDALSAAPAHRVAVSPMVGTGSVAGPAGELMRLAHQPPTSTGVAALYRDVIDGIVIDTQDVAQARDIETMGIAVLVTDTIMRDASDRERLASETLAFAKALR